eukprot:Lithocolla_globosa_v1_NODE_1667_length_2409_cov_9.852229.p3 type:complete len:157 gc:universal NODE_1667_length_2409_cov_9.852229:1368-898(-)
MSHGWKKKKKKNHVTGKKTSKMEFMANLVPYSGSKPTYFELAAADSMSEMQKPALHYVLLVYAQRYPSRLLYIYNHFEEFYALLTLVIEKHYLDTCDATFAENFYGIYRTKYGNSETSLNSSSPQNLLDSSDRRNILLVLVVWPYLFAKFDSTMKV